MAEVDPFRLHTRAATPQAEARAVAARMRAYYNDQGNAQYLRKLIYEDSATIVSLIPAIEAAAGADSDATRDVYQAASICGSVGECGGNIGMWALVPIYADKLESALDVLEEEQLPNPPAATIPPVAIQTGNMLDCSPGTWVNGPTGFGYQWVRDDVDIAGATVSSYTLSLEDFGKTFKCIVTGTNEGGSAATVSNTLLAEAPANGAPAA